MRRNNLLLLLILLCLVSIGCPQTNFTPPDPAERTGAMLVRHGKYMYLIGGKTSTGEISNEVYYAEIPSDDSAVHWLPTVPLTLEAENGRSVPRAFGSAFVAGNLLYVLGGEDSGGPTDTILYIYIKPSNGTLGLFDNYSKWSKNPTPLPQALSHSAVTQHEGRLFVIGGKTPSGLSDHIYHARISPDGFVGNWYTSPQKISTGLQDVSVCVLPSFVDMVPMDSKLVIAGGRDEMGNVTSSVTTHDMGGWGLLSNPSSLASLPKALYATILLNNGDELIVAGGFDAEAQFSTSIYTYTAGSWSQPALISNREGPSFAQVAGALWAVAGIEDGDNPVTVERKSLPGLTPEPPNIFPSSGMVKSNTKVLGRSQTNGVMEYRLSSDAVWTVLPTSTPLLAITADSTYLFRETVGAASTIARRDYRVSVMETYPHISGDISVQSLPGAPDTWELETLFLGENLKVQPDTASERTTVLARLLIPADDEYVIRWQDKISTPSSSYTGKIELTLVENDLVTEAVDSSGLPVMERISTAGNILMALQKGTYYLRLSDVDGVAGTSFGLVVVRQ
ncbi:MAG: hypothetical protein CVV52_08705 [Spirochaetae bacterium HGW-Spirochaetae-8]|nr:MAG: hypothetical protein CVV52_08705 [Spirochaetae bacterium HGW-Spirochaetae-8]